MIKLGNHSYNYGIQRGAANDVIVGNYTAIAENVLFDSGFNHRTDWISTFPFAKIWSELPSNIIPPKDIIIGSGVWIGEGAIIMNNVKIGHGSIVGCNTVVTKNIEPYSVVVGAPMKVTRKLYTDDQIAALLKIAWWEWEENKVHENVDKLMSNNIQEFIDLHK